MTHDDEFNVIVKYLTNNPYVLDMKIFRQHCDTSTFEHSYKVAYISYKICKKLNLDYVKENIINLIYCVDITIRFNV